MDKVVLELTKQELFEYVAYRLHQLCEFRYTLGFPSKDSVNHFLRQVDTLRRQYRLAFKQLKVPESGDVDTNYLCDDGEHEYLFLVGASHSIRVVSGDNPCEAARKLGTLPEGDVHWIEIACMTTGSVLGGKFDPYDCFEERRSPDESPT